MILLIIIIITIITTNGNKRSRQELASLIVDEGHHALSLLAYVSVLRPISLPRSSLLRFVDSNFAEINLWT